MFDRVGAFVQNVGVEHDIDFAIVQVELVFAAGQHQNSLVVLAMRLQNLQHRRLHIERVNHAARTNGAL